MKRLFCLLLLCLLPLYAAAEDFGVSVLTPIARDAESSSVTLPLYCGPTQQFSCLNETTADFSQPYVYFGQYDCWAMVATGTPDHFGPVGWVEAAALSALPYDPQLNFEDSLPVMIEEETILTVDPCADDPTPLMTLTRGETVTLLAVWGEWGYVQYEGGT